VIVALVVAGSTPVGAAEKESRACRAQIATQLGKLVRLGIRQVDQCRVVRNRASAPGGVCNVIGSAEFDPKGRYRAARGRAQAKIAAKCRAGDPVLVNYPGGDLAAVLDAVDGAVAGNAVLVQGNANLAGNKKNGQCIRAIGRGRGAVFARILKASTGCQRRRDRRATSFGPIDESCVDGGGSAPTKAAAKINRACAGASGIGACAPLPDCATSAARTAAQGLARAVYSLLADRPVCGDGAVTFPEQCDDGNTTAGDGCDAACELEGGSCTGPIGARTVRVEVTTPMPLSGLRIDVEYPQFEAGIPGTGQSAIVAGRVTLLQGAGETVATLANDRDSDVTVVFAAPTAAISSGALVDLALEACVPLGANICNRNQNVIGCCDATTDADGDLTFQECTDPNAPVICPAGSFPLDSVGPGGVEDCCPGDNACITQAAATTCSVTDPVGPAGQTVDGVTCTATSSGT
jgi:cysteine-rich repeat protein